MVNLWEQWERIKRDLARKEKIFLFLDYDGTLTPIVPRPDQAFLDDATRNLLRSLAALPFLSLFVISGRSIEDLKKLSGLEDLPLVGCHGLEREEGLRIPPDEVDTYKGALNTISGRLAEELGSLKGFLLEKKGISVALHFRMADEASANKIREVARRTVTPGKLFKIKPGKKVLEILPDARIDKGQAVLDLLRENREGLPAEKMAALHVGDDETDEDVFRAIEPYGWGIKVGEGGGESSARYFLRSCREVPEFLGKLRELKGASG